MALNGPHQVITPDWPDAACDAEAQPRSEWTGNPLAEILKVREANGGGCWAERVAERTFIGRAARPCQAWPCVAGRRFAGVCGWVGVDSS